VQIKTKIVSSYTASKIGGQWYSDTSPLSIPCPNFSDLSRAEHPGSGGGGFEVAAADRNGVRRSKGQGGAHPCHETSGGTGNYQVPGSNPGKVVRKCH
jgi:hypothetical protein